MSLDDVTRPGDADRCNAAIDEVEGKRPPQSSPIAHTPGPWRIGTSCGSVVADHAIPDLGGSGDVDYYGGHLVAESIAPRNQPVIAAAPDLLETLVMVRDADDDCRRDGLAVIPDVARARIDAVIAKAQGRS